jgi:hypothetical protein
MPIKSLNVIELKESERERVGEREMSCVAHVYTKGILWRWDKRRI